MAPLVYINHSVNALFLCCALHPSLRSARSPEWRRRAISTLLELPQSAHCSGDEEEEGDDDDDDDYVWLPPPATNPTLRCGFSKFTLLLNGPDELSENCCFTQVIPIQCWHMGERVLAAQTTLIGFQLEAETPLVLAHDSCVCACARARACFDTWYLNSSLRNKYCVSATMCQPSS